MKNKIIEILRQVATHRIEAEYSGEGNVYEEQKHHSHTATDLSHTTLEIRKYISNRIWQLELQLDDPEVLDQKRIQCKLEAYQEMVSMKFESHPTPEISEDFKDKIKTLIGYLKIWNRSGRMCFPPPELNGVIEEADVWIKELNDK